MVYGHSVAEEQVTDNMGDFGNLVHAEHHNPLDAATQEGNAVTAKDDVCDVCGLGPVIGVASTSIPLSVAYCAECIKHGADPEVVFEYWATCGITPADHRDPSMLTYRDGKYINYSDWYAKYATKSNEG